MESCWKIGSELIHRLPHWAMIMSVSDEISHFSTTGDACVGLLIVIKSLICTSVSHSSGLRRGGGQGWGYSGSLYKLVLELVMESDCSSIVQSKLDCLVPLVSQLFCFSVTPSLFLSPKAYISHRSFTHLLLPFVLLLAPSPSLPFSPSFSPLLIPSLLFFPSFLVPSFLSNCSCLFYWRDWA